VACVNYPFLEGMLLHSLEFACRLLTRDTPETLPNDTTPRTTKRKTQCWPRRATYLPLRASTVQVRRLAVTSESPVRGVQKKIYNAKLGLLVEGGHKDPLFGPHPRGKMRVQILGMAS